MAYTVPGTSNTLPHDPLPMSLSSTIGAVGMEVLLRSEKADNVGWTAPIESVRLRTSNADSGPRICSDLKFRSCGWDKGMGADSSEVSLSFDIIRANCDCRGKIRMLSPRMNGRTMDTTAVFCSPILYFASLCGAKRRKMPILCSGEDLGDRSGAWRGSLALPVWTWK